MLEPLCEWTAEDSIEGLSWSPQSDRLLISPSSGDFAQWQIGEEQPSVFWPGHPLNNGLAAFGAQGDLLLPAADGSLLLQPVAGLPTRMQTGRKPADFVRWSPDGQLAATAHGRELLLHTRLGKFLRAVSGPKGMVCDAAWNPCAPDEITVVGDGGAVMWRLDESEPFTRFDWGGASLIVIWSPDGRWIVTGDQTPSVHLFDFTRYEPLHIQGYENKVRCLSFHTSSEILATGGSALITLWDCTGPRGPEGTTPRRLEGHADEIRVLAFAPQGDLLASGDKQGLLLLFHPRRQARPLVVRKYASEITALAWSPDARHLALGTAQGLVALLNIPVH